MSLIVIGCIPGAETPDSNCTLNVLITSSDVNSDASQYFLKIFSAFKHKGIAARGRDVAWRRLFR